MMKAAALSGRLRRAHRAQVFAALTGCVALVGCAASQPASQAAPRSVMQKNEAIAAEAHPPAPAPGGDGIPDPLEGRIGDATRGKALLVQREAANCILCHALPQLGLRFAGNIGPSLEAAGRKFSSAQLRLRIVDSTRLDPAATMPSYYRVDGLDRVAVQYRGQPILDAQQVEDIVAYLAQLR